MSVTKCASPIPFADLVNYLADDLDRADADRIEEHVFACADCARELGAAEALASGVAEIVRAGRFHSVITDAILNRLSADGVRMRTYTLEAHAITPCSVWADDDLVVARIRADFT